MTKKLDIRFLYLIIIFISFLFFRGRLGSDDIEVYNFVKYFISSELSFKDFIINLDFYIDKTSRDEDIQVFGYNTWSHRFIWIFQTYIITKLVYILNFFWDFDKIFFSQYFAGYVLTFYSFLSYLLVYLYLRKYNNFYYSFLLSSIIFFGTGLISFFTGSYIESLILLLFVLRVISQELKKKILFDLLIILIKPYYFVYIAFLYFCDNKSFIKNIKIYFFLILSFIIIKFIITYNFPTQQSNLDFLKSFNPNLDLELILNNLYNFYFSYGVGILFSSTIIIILFIFGYNKDSKFKILGLLFLSIFLCLWEGFHGYAPGGRYFLPIVVTFLTELNSGFNYLFKNLDKIKFRFTSFIILFLLILNLPVLEYRNTNLASYLNQSAKKEVVINKLVIKDGKIIKKNTPIEKITYNHLIFSNIIVVNKIFGSNNIYFNNQKIELSDIYPMTGIARVIYIGNNKLEIYGKKINEFANNYKKILIFFYALLASVYIFLIIYCYYNLISLIKKK